MAGHKSTMYQQGNGWIVSSWSDQHDAYGLSGEMSYQQARAIVGRDNCRNPKTCTIHDHND